MNNEERLQEARYQQILALLTSEDFYRALGPVRPYTDNPITLDIIRAPNTEFQVLLNDEVIQSSVKSNSSGLVQVTLPERLEPGAYELRLENRLLGQNHRSYFEIRHLATIIAMIADVIGKFDVELDSIERSISIRSSTADYIDPVYGQRVNQAKPPEFSSISAYRNLVEALIQGYRQFAGTRRGLEQAIESYISTSPFVLPKAWISSFRPGEQLIENHEFQRRTRVSAAQYRPAGVDFADLNRQSLIYVHPSVSLGSPVIAGSESGGGPRIFNPPRSQPLTVTISGGSVEITGTIADGTQLTETVLSNIASSKTYVTKASFGTVTKIERIEGTDSAKIGVSESRFVRVRRLGSYCLTGNTAYTLTNTISSTDSTLRIGNGTPVSLAGLTEPTAITLRDTPRNAVLIGGAATSSTYSLNPIGSTSLLDAYDQLTVRINGIVTTYTFGATSVSPASAVSALSGLSGFTASDIVGGDGNSTTFMRLSSNDAFEFVSTGPDASSFIFKSSDRYTSLAVGALVNARSLTVLNGAGFPSSDFDVVVRGLRRASSGANDGIVTAIPENTQRATFTSASTTFSSADVGGVVRLAASNAGTHKIVGCTNSSTVTLQHENSAGSGVFTNASNLQFSVFSPHGERHRVVSRSGNELTLASGLTQSWPVGALVEIPETLGARPSLGLGEVEVEVDTSFDPYLSRGEKLDASTAPIITLVSSRANFPSGLTGSVVISGATNPENNGTFPINTREDFTEITFTNANAITETSSFQWRIVPTNPTTLSNTISITGPGRPDGWRISPDAATVTYTNAQALADGSPGATVPSRMIVKGAVREGLVIERDVPLALRYRGLKLKCSVWLQDHTNGSEHYDLKVAFNSGLPATVAHTLISSTPAQWGSNVASHNLSLITGEFFVPYNATRCVVSVVGPTTTPATTMSIERFELICPEAAGLRVGQGVVRSAKRSKFREVVYLWTPDEGFSSDSLGFIGIDPNPDVVNGLPPKPGHIDYITNAHGFWERFDFPKAPRFGLYTNENWQDRFIQEGLRMLEVKPEQPEWASYVSPTTVSLVETTLNFVLQPGGHYEATGLLANRHLGPYPQAPNTGGATGATLIEYRPTTTTMVFGNRSYALLGTTAAPMPVPVPDTTPAGASNPPWRFLEDGVRLESDYYTVGSTYRLTYPVLILATTGPISLPADRADYVWLVDAAFYRRENPVERLRSVVEELVLINGFSASTNGQIDTDEPVAVFRDDGITRIELAQNEYVLEDAQTVRINATSYVEGAVYTIEYTSKALRLEPTSKITIQWRSADTQEALATATWIEVAKNQVISPLLDTADADNNLVHQFHELRLFVDELENTPDFRLYGLGLKGIKLYGNSPNAPALSRS